nr:MAG TPA: RNaseH [Caudoviricetes sp.]
MRLERKNSNCILFCHKTKKEAFEVRKPYKKLTYADRQTIERMSAEGQPPKAIAEVTGVHIATIYRELQRGEDAEGHYKAELAQQALFC